MLLLTMALLPLVSSHWRTRYYLLTVFAALVVAAPWAVIWPMLLEARSPHLFAQWFWVENVERLKGIFIFTAGAGHFFFFCRLPACSPAPPPLTLWGRWVWRRGARVGPWWRS